CLQLRPILCPPLDVFVRSADRATYIRCSTRVWTRRGCQLLLSLLLRAGSCSALRVPGGRQQDASTVEAVAVRSRRDSDRLRAHPLVDACTRHGAHLLGSADLLA